MSLPGCLKRRRTSAAWVAGATAVLVGLVTSACGADNSSAGSTTALSGSSSSPSPEPESAPEFAEKLRPALTAKMEELRVPGAIVLVDVPGQGQWLAALGVGDLAAGLSQQPGEAGGSRSPELRVTARAAPTTPGRASTIGSLGRGKQDGAA